MIPSLSSLVVVAAAAAMALFGCEGMDRGPSDPQPPKTAAASTGAPTFAATLPSVH